MSGERTQAPDDIDQLQHQIDETREELADTVGALAAKADIKARAAEKAEHIRTQAVRRSAREPPPRRRHCWRCSHGANGPERRSAQARDVC
jgi:hypothetical protein